jgi:hypothetical protein
VPPWLSRLTKKPRPSIAASSARPVLVTLPPTPMFWVSEHADGLAAGVDRRKVGPAALEAVGTGVGDVVTDRVQLVVDGLDAGQSDVETHVNSF